MLSLDGVRLMYGWTIFYRRRGWYTVQRRVWCIGLTYEFNSYHLLCHYYRQAIATALLSLIILHGYVKSPRVSSFALQILPASHFVRGHMMCTKNIWLQDIHYIRLNYEPNRPLILGGSWKWQHSANICNNQLQKFV